MSSIATTPAMAPLSRRSIANAGYLVVLLLLPNLCLLAGVLDIEVYLASTLLAAAVVIVLRSSQRLEISGPGLILLFFTSAALHAVIGYVMAPAASARIWIGNAAPRFYATSILVIATGLVSAAVGYAVTVQNKFAAIRHIGSSFQADDRRFLWAARAILIAGAVLMLGVYARMDFAPLLTASPTQARYFSSALGNDYLVSEWLVARALDLLMFGIPLMFISGSWRKNRWDLLLALMGFMVMLLPLRRANALSVPFVLLVMGSLRSGKLALKRGLMAALLVAAYGISQLILTLPAELDLQYSVISLGTALPEVRDLGWTIELLDGDRLYGSTFAQALNPLPSFASDFSKRESLRAITSRLIGLETERTTGGLRLTLAGEAFLNFDYFGSVFFGFLFGVACSFVRVLAETLRTKQTIWAYYVASVAFVWVCFWVYLGGTQAAATVKIGALLLGSSLLFARQKGTALHAEVSA